MPLPLAISAVNPLLLWGSAAVAVPILIHLLSKRKFKVVDWAAMDFLLEADQRNRRRLRLEDLLLLLLRCLAVLLIALLVSRLFLEPAGVGAKALGQARFERLVLLDDSPSMTASAGENRSAFEAGRDGMAAFLRDLVRQNPGDQFTLLTTSQPASPVVAGRYLTPDTVEDVALAVEQLTPSDRAAELDRALAELSRRLDDSEGNLNRVVYVVTDLRRRDWFSDAATGATNNLGDGADSTGTTPTGGDNAKDPAVIGLLRNLSEQADGVVVVDVGADTAPGKTNLTLTAVRALDKTLVAQVPARFEVEVRNSGSVPSDDTEVVLTAGDSAPMRARTGVIAPGESAVASFAFTFGETGPAALVAELGPDVLPADNARYLAADVQDGVHVLMVDGDPSSEAMRAERYFLERALAPPGDAASGNVVEAVTEDQFETIDLDRFQLVFLCNLYRITDDRLTTLRRWVEAGGGLVVFLGDQVDESVYNRRLFDEGKGLLPLRLEAVRGDPTERTHVNLKPQSTGHPVLGIFEGAQNPFVQNVKVFRWWQGAVSDKAAAAGRVNVLATLTDLGGSPALVEKAVGAGRVLLWTVPCDADWSNWPADPSYVVTMLEQTRYAAKATSGGRTVAVGAPVTYVVDPARYQLTARLTPPAAPGAAEPVTLTAQPVGEGDGAGTATPDEGVAPGPDTGAGGDEEADTALAVRSAPTDRRGFYRLALTARDGQEREVTFAANLDPREGELARVSEADWGRRLGDAPVELVRGWGDGPGQTVGARAELWRPLLLALVLVLCVEQLLAWTFGRRR